MSMITAFCLFASLSGLATACATAAALVSKHADADAESQPDDFRDASMESKTRGALITAPTR